MLEMSGMERNCWAVFNEVSLRIDQCVDGSPGPHCIMKGFVLEEKNTILSKIAQSNFEKMGVSNIDFIHGDGIGFLSRTELTFDWI